MSVDRFGSPEVAQAEPPTLFDEPEPVGAPSWAQQVVASGVYAEQRKLAGRIVLTDTQVMVVLERLVAAPHQRLTAHAAAAALGLPTSSVPGAVEQLRKLLNVEGYPVITRDTATSELILDVQLAAEQFQVSL
jgi:hypothetical protein